MCSLQDNALKISMWFQLQTQKLAADYFFWSRSITSVYEKIPVYIQCLEDQT